MNMESKYYVPDIEDIRVGYECEFLSGHGAVGMLWKPIVVNQSMFPTIFRDHKLLRTPYLTKEQFEGEGWKEANHSLLFTDYSGYDNSKDYYARMFEKDNYILYYNEGNKILSLMIRDPSLEDDSVFGKMPVFRGECKSINEFRYICKLCKKVNYLEV